MLWAKAPIYVRLTIDGQLCQFSTKSDVSMKLWDPKRYCAVGRSSEGTLSQAIRRYVKRMHADSFALYTIKKVKTRRRFLTKQEFARFYHFQSANKRLQRVRDVFLFSCFTGLRYDYLRELTDFHLAECQDGRNVLLFHAG